MGMYWRVEGENGGLTRTTMFSFFRSTQYEEGELEEKSFWEEEEWMVKEDGDEVGYESDGSGKCKALCCAMREKLNRAVK